MAVVIHCSKCGNTFDFDNPAIRSAYDLVHVTIDCAWCGAVLKMPTDELHMVDMEEFMRRQLLRSGIITKDDRNPGLRIVDRIPPSIAT